MKAFQQALLLMLVVFQLPAQQPSLDSLIREYNRQSKEDTFKLKTTFAIVNLYTDSHPDSAMILAMHGLKISEKLTWEKGISAFQNSIGRLQSNNGENMEALKHYQLAYLSAKRTDNAGNMAVNLNNLGSAYQRLNNFAKAIEYTLEALRVAEKRDVSFMIALCNENLAHLYFEQRDYKKSLDYAFEGLTLHEQQKNEEGIADCNQVIGDVYVDQLDYQKAEYYYLKSQVIYDKINNLAGKAALLSHLALVYEKDKEKKLRYLFMAKAIFDSTTPKHLKAIGNLGNIGGTYAEIVLHDSIISLPLHSILIPRNRQLLAGKAKFYLEAAVQLANETRDVDNVANYSAELAQLQEYLGDTRGALANLKLYQKIHDSLYSQEVKNKMATLESGYIFGKKEQVYLQQQEVNKLKMKQLWLYGLLVALALAASLVFYIYRGRIKQLRLQNTIQQQESERSTRDLMYQTKISDSELKAIRSQMNPHFIFNVLNSIESYILENDARTASRLVQKFASLSRLILENSTQSLVIAEREWKALQLYTELEAMRYGNSFSYTFEIDPFISLTKIFVPPMLVQPLIENAIHHGLRPRRGQGDQLSVELAIIKEQVIFTVTDNGVGIDQSTAGPHFSSLKQQSMGLAAIRDRIELLNVGSHGSKAAFQIRDLSLEGQQGTTAVITLPLIFIQTTG